MIYSLLFAQRQAAEPPASGVLLAAHVGPSLIINEIDYPEELQNH
jgi:hypothetical protein